MRSHYRFAHRVALQLGLPGFDFPLPRSELVDPFKLSLADLLDVHLIRALSISYSASSCFLATYIGIAQSPETGIHVRKRLVLADSLGPMNLHGPVDHFERDTRNRELLLALE